MKRIAIPSRGYTVFALGVLLLAVGHSALAIKGEAEAIWKSPLTPDQKAAHLLNRLTYGPTPGALANVKELGLTQFIEQQLSPHSLDDDTLASRLQSLETIHMPTRRLAQLFPRSGVIKRLVDNGAISKDQLPQRRFRNSFANTDKGSSNERANPEAENRPRDSQRRRDRMSRSGRRNLIYGSVTYLPEPIEVPGRRGRNQPPILGINPQRMIVAQMQAAKLIRTVHGERQLQEVMVDFWMNHFNVFMAKGIERILMPSYERDVIRPHALGRFRDLLGATAHSPAMLFYLDNFQSVSPESFLGKRRNRGLNENYARELMELHTLGVDGGYTQQDVVEVAKVFTGWTFMGSRGGGNRRPRGRGNEMQAGADDRLGFRFLPVAHAPGDKKVLGHTIRAGSVDEGEKVLDLLARHPSTARFLATKLVRRFVADDPPESLVKKVAATYRKTDGDIRAMLRTIFHSREFWSDEVFRAKTKKPLELVASTLRALGADVKPTPVLLVALERMGEPLYLCQPPTGYPDVGDEWLNSGTLLYRWKFALGAATGNVPGIEYPHREDLQGEDARTVLAELSKDLLPAQLSEKTQAKIEGMLSEQLAKRSDLEAPLGGREVRYLAGLVLGSPEFQRR